jgi:hypothetical protein
MHSLDNARIGIDQAAQPTQQTWSSSGYTKRFTQAINLNHSFHWKRLLSLLTINEL